MRLTKIEKDAIQEVVFSFDKSATIYLFGSRVDDKKKGGDIDLLLISNSIKWQDKRKIRLQLFDKIGEQKIDIIISKEGDESTFAEIAKEEGIKL